MEDLVNEIKKVLDQPITYKRLAVNTLIIYFHGEPGDKGIKYFVIPPSWRYQKNGILLLGNYDIPFDKSDVAKELDFKTEFNRICSLSDDLIGSRLIDFKITSETNDLELLFEHNQKVFKFQNSIILNYWQFDNGKDTFEIYCDKILKNAL
jgi:hypothetical protein